MKKGTGFFVSIVLVISVLCSGCSQYSGKNNKKNIDVNILYVENRKFQGLSEEDIQMITAFIKKDMLRFFEINVKNITIEKMDIEDYLKNERKPKVDMRDDYKVTQIMSVHYEKLKFIKDNKEWSKFFENKSIRGIAQEIIDKNKKVLKMLGIEKGNPNEYTKHSLMSWHRRLGKIKKYNLVLYNGVLIDDYGEIPLHTLIHGFIASGCAVKNNSKYKGTGMVVTLPVMSDDLPFSKWRGEGLSIIEKRKVISMIACHEYGHLLFDYDEMYKHDNCIMNPVRAYDCKSFLSTKKCNKRHPKRGYFTEAVFK
ncbi:MAG: hypothetical protein ABIJ15_00255 [bacterium]